MKIQSIFLPSGRSAPVNTGISLSLERVNSRQAWRDHLLKLRNLVTLTQAMRELTIARHHRYHQYQYRSTFCYFLRQGFMEMMFLALSVGCNLRPAPWVMILAFQQKVQCALNLVIDKAAA